MEPEARHKIVRYYEIDLLRFLAALSVVLFYFTYRGFHANNLSPVEYLALGEVFKYGYLGVQLFFMISGYVVLMSAQGKTLAQLFASRGMRLYPAYWVACTLTFLVVRLIGPTVPSPMMNTSVRVYAYSMTMFQHFFGVPDLDHVYWTLSIELVFYFLIALVIGFGWMKHLLVVLTAWLAYCALTGPAVESSPFSFLLLPRHAPFSWRACYSTYCKLASSCARKYTRCYSGALPSRYAPCALT
jgi:peptidoglycan/LPS O-acetylase OafA/YrhL